MPIAYDETLTVALATGVHPQRMLADPVPPGWSGRSVPGEAHEAWLRELIGLYGDLKPSMLQDFETPSAVGRASAMTDRDGAAP